MPTGLQIWDENGRVILDTNNRLARLLGRVNFSGNGSIVDAKLTTGEPFFFAQYHAPPTVWPETAPQISVTFSGNRMSWQLVRDSRSPATGVIFYGVW